MLWRFLCTFVTFSCCILLLARAFVNNHKIGLTPTLLKQRILQPIQRETVLYGIPKLFRWLIDLYPLVVESVGKESADRSLSVDNFYLDMNGIIHACTHSNSDDLVLTSEKDMFIRIFAYTDRLYKLVRPKRLMFLAVDGVAPRAKMNQQRSRRFRSSKEREALLSEYVLANGELPKTESFDSNCITPGTEFMHKLSLAFQKWIEYKMETDPFWKNGAEVVFSGPDVPGEGEHKVMDMVREMQAADPNYQLGQWRHCMYGLDADLIMLSLVTHEPFFVLLREKQNVRRQNKDALKYSPQDFELLEVSILRRMLHTHFKTLFKGKKSDEENQELLASARATERQYTGGKSIDMIVKVEEEQQLFRQMASKRLEAALESTDIDSTPHSNATPVAKDLSRIIDDFVFMCFFIGNDFLPSIPHLDIADGSLNVMMNTYLEMYPELGGHLTDKDRLHLPRIELFIQELSRREPLYFEQRAVDDKDPAFVGPGYKDHYYKIKFGLEPGDIAGRRQIVQSYVEGLAWVARYYHHGCGSWTWFYPYLYAPLASDLVELAGIQINFPQGRLFTPLMQLLSVLPSQSGKFLPPSYSDLMTNELSPLASYYPKVFNVDANGKRNAWESVVLIPFIDEETLIDNVNLIDHATTLSELEKQRNRMGKAHRYVPTLGHDMFRDVSKNSKHKNPDATENTSKQPQEDANNLWGNALAEDSRNSRYPPRSSSSNPSSSSSKPNPAGGNYNTKSWSPNTKQSTAASTAPAAAATTTTTTTTTTAAAAANNAAPSNKGASSSTSSSFAPNGRLQKAKSKYGDGLEKLNRPEVW